MNLREQVARALHAEQRYGTPFDELSPHVRRELLAQADAAIAVIAAQEPRAESAMATSFERQRLRKLEAFAADRELLWLLDATNSSVKRPQLYPAAGRLGRQLRELLAQPLGDSEEQAATAALAEWLVAEEGRSYDTHGLPDGSVVCFLRTTREDEYFVDDGSGSSSAQAIIAALTVARRLDRAS